MDSVQSADVAMQYGQSFGRSAEVSVVTPVQAASQLNNVQQQNPSQQQQHQYHQRQHYTTVPIPKDPVILNHVLPGVRSSAVDPVLSTVTTTHIPQPQQQQQQQQQIHQQIRPLQLHPMKMWLLVEWESSDGDQNSYSVIDSDDLVLHSQSGQSGAERIHTGKTIWVRRGKRVLQATVVIISDDRQFIDTEVRQLRKMASENLYRKKNISQEQQYSAATNQEHPAKRCRVEHAPTESEELEPASPEFEPMPTQSQIAAINWVVGDNTKERIISPSPSVASSVQVTNPAAPLAKPPPMTFDQQTQTDTKYFIQEGLRTNQQEFTKILSLLETILAEQKTIHMETEYNRKLTYDMMEQQNTFSETLKEVAAKMDANRKYEITEVVKNPMDHVSSYVVLGTGGDESRDRASSVAESVAQKPAISNDSCHLAIDNVSVQEESNMSFNESKFTIHEESSVNSVTSTPKNLNFTNKLSSSALSVSNVSIQSHLSGQPSNNNKGSAINEMLEEWVEEDEEVKVTSIGPNSTLVKKQILRAINWTNYKAATRKLLMTLFSREVLASHTLTGRPSPAFMGDRAKPVKDKLDQKIIADIISIVSKTCNVSEAMVRTAITTKCADENKMSRMKHNKSGGGSQMRIEQDTDSVCGDVVGAGVAGSGDHVERNSAYPRRIKRENKENVH